MPAATEAPGESVLIMQSVNVASLAGEFCEVVDTDEVIAQLG